MSPSLSVDIPTLGPPPTPAERAQAARCCAAWAADAAELAEFLAALDLDIADARAARDTGRFAE